MAQFLKVKNKFINMNDIKTFHVECAKEYCGDVDYPDCMVISDFFLILDYYNGTSEEYHFYSHYYTESRFDEIDDFEETMTQLIGTDSFKSLMRQLINTKEYRDGDDYVREEDKRENHLTY